jgi:hypothetical protein
LGHILGYFSQTHLVTLLPTQTNDFSGNEKNAPNFKTSKSGAILKRVNPVVMAGFSRFWLQIQIVKNSVTRCACEKPPKM